MWNKDLQKSVINFGFLIRFYWNHCIPIMCLHEHLTSGEVKCNDFNSQYHGFKPIMNFWKSSPVFPRIIPNLSIIRYSRVSITDHASKIWLPGCSNLAMNGENDNNVGICRRDITVNFFGVAVFLLSSLIIGPSCMAISVLVLKLWQFLFIRDSTETRKLEISPSEFCPISGDWGKLGIPNLARMSLVKSYWMLQNARVTAFTVSELLREN